MKLIHNSYSEITSISKFGRFGSFLFFAESSCHYGDVTYSIEIDESEIVDAKEFFYREDCALLNDLVAEVMELADCDEDTAQELLSQRDHHEDAEIDWDIQLLTAKSAKILGYRGVAVPDEHGTSYMIDMYGKESELEQVK